MGLEFQIQGDKVCYTPLKDKCDAIRNLASPKNLRQTRAFCRMVNFLSSFLPNLHRLLILIYNLQKKAKKFKWTEEAEKYIYMIKSKTESPMTRLKTLLLKLSEYTIELKYQKGSEMHTSDALSRLHSFTDTPNQKDVFPLNFLQHSTPHYIEHSYSHLVENLYAHKTKTLDPMTVKRKHGRPPKPKSQIPTSKPRTPTAAKNLTTQP